MTLDLAPLTRARDAVPLPLAQLIVRLVNAKSILERHQGAFYLCEVALKLAAVVRAAPLLAHAPPERVATAVRKLARASLGHWQELLRESDREAAVADRLSEQTFAAGGAMVDAMVAADLLDRDAARAAKRHGVLGFFDVLVAYRNAVIGHGSTRASAFYEAWTARLVEALGAALAMPALFVGSDLVIADASEEGDARARLLRGPAPLPWDGSALTGPGLWVVARHGASNARPLLCHRDDGGAIGDRIGFLQEVRASTRGGTLDVKRVEYLDYASGDTVTDDEARTAAAGVVVRAGDATAAPEPDAAVRVEAGGRIGGFDLLDRVGAGAQAQVFRARQRGIDRVVALKVLRGDVASDDNVRRRFEREVRALVRTDHPNVIKVYAAGQDGGTYYYAMELVDGVDLGRAADVLAAIRAAHAGNAYWLRLAALFAGACDGVQHLHERDIVHRDLKAENLLLTADGTRLVVTDLGLARLADASAMTRESSMLGTLRSMAPEQLDGGDAAARPAVDVFGLGVALFEAATGRALRDAPTEAAVVAQIGLSAPRADRVDTRVPHRIADIIARALERAPAARWPSAGSMRDALRALDADALARGGTSRLRIAIGASLAAAAIAIGVGAVAMHGSHRSPEPAMSLPAPRIDASAPSDAAIAQAFPPPPAEQPAPPGMVRIDAPAKYVVGSSPDEIAATKAWCARFAPNYCAERGERFDAEALTTVATRSPTSFLLDAHELSRAELIALLDRAPTWKVDHDRVVAADGTPLVAIGPGTGIAWRAAAHRFEVDQTASLPAIGVSWAGAHELCKLRGDYLPLADQWELAARGVERRTFPWGADEPTCDDAVFGAHGVERWPTCSHNAAPRAVDRADVGRDVTPQHVRDLAGNVAEWVDAVGPSAPDKPPPCPHSFLGMLRGGSYASQPDELRGARRRFACADELPPDVGVRCAR